MLLKIMLPEYNNVVKLRLLLSHMKC